MAAPVMDPGRRHPATVAAMSDYEPGATVWLYRPDGWRPGLVLACSQVAALVRFRPTEQRGTAVDTVTAERLVPRVERDEWLDKEGLVTWRFTAPILR